MKAPNENREVDFRYGAIDDDTLLDDVEKDLVTPLDIPSWSQMQMFQKK